MARIPSITNSNLYKRATKALSKGCSVVGKKLNSAFDKHQGKDIFTKVISKLEPNGSNNSFYGMAGLMVGTVIIPRVITASKRNPNDKEATKDEITEILFRDVQTVLIILFGLKALNAVVAAASGKLKGLPMTNKPYEKLFNTTEKGLKGIKEKAVEFFEHPIEKAKKIGKNIIDTLNPLGGVEALSKEQFVEKYTKYNSIEEVSKFFKDISNHGGENQNAKGAKKVYDKLIDDVIAQAQQICEENKTKANLGMAAEDSQGVLARIDRLKKLKEKGIEGLNTLDAENEVDKGVANLITDYLKKENNPMVKSALGLNAGLKSAALVIEAAYLCFGLPALNQKRLEKKYLNKEASCNKNAPQQAVFNPLVDRNIKAQEVKIFHNFIK